MQMIIKNFGVATQTSGDMELTTINIERKAPVHFMIEKSSLSFNQNKLEFHLEGKLLMSIVNIPFFHQLQIKKDGVILRFKSKKAGMYFSYGVQQSYQQVG